MGSKLDRVKMFKNGVTYTIFRLQLHLPGQHNVTFHENDDLEALLLRAEEGKLTLTEFFRYTYLQQCGV